MSDRNVAINRPLVGIIALLCLGLSAGLWLSGSVDAEDGFVMGAGAIAAFFRVGLLMGALWLALPSKDREAAWAKVSPNTLLGLFLAILGTAWRPRIAIPVILVLGAMALILRPRTKQRPPRN